MKASKVASVVAALLATDAKPSEAQILAAIIAADKKGKDEGGLGPVEIEKKDQAKDKAKDEDKDEKAKDKAKDSNDDPEHTNDGDLDDVDGMDEDKDDEKKAKDDIQPSEKPDGGRAGKEPAKDKKGMDEAGVAALIAANDAKHAAAREVESVIGVVSFDSADKYYKAALDKLGVSTDGVHASAFPALLKMAKDRAKSSNSLAADSARVTSMAAAIPGYDRLK